MPWFERIAALPMAVDSIPCTASPFRASERFYRGVITIMSMRTHTCGELRQSNIDTETTICGWVNTFRDQGKGLVFIDVRDRTGLTQVVFDQEDCNEDVMERARSLRR